MTGKEQRTAASRRVTSEIIPPLNRRGLLQAGGTLLAAGLGTAGLSACGSGSGGGSGTSGGKTQLTLMSWEPFEPAEKPAWFKVVRDFEAANPHIKVTWTGWPFATYDQNVIAQAQAGAINADVVMCPPELATALIQKFDACVPLQHLTDELKLARVSGIS